ncbi:DUF3298 domain-containing protein [Rodentibacter pneumotropicus]|uniref:DUF3298 domain-containing protein n=1 Tax=Rodentibacter pneumotropicus TaxID=758 RepID=A0AAW5L5V5_9PAST|nr:DUF3298 domain-containing protein [Rodentibacter pneumotropicus]MCQ9120168.1 DUF3298 domain-containing protein [Rodentibacter pneumotropicus]NBH76408.1 DUF3298 domain-containing protein [Rodentibacter pneumotropicus]OOF63342.1 hypothetical protein BH925_08340 [Rodentibacter pneumotropicus]OOF67347.1 hypothetical protein BKG95_07605 [Rodentibacter pneumotropicus]THA01219.1 DUF3298 domain-containing protein [Rodentibacter pneumotropicus]
MKKTFISAVILTALLSTGCQDKEAQAKIEQLNQTVTQLTAENTQLKADLTAEKERVEKIIPAIFTEKDVIFDKTETFKYPQSKGDYAPEEGSVTYSISILKTNIDWLNTLLWDELTQEEGKVPSREQLVANYQKHFDETRKGMMEEPSIAFESSRWVDFIGQKEKLATFAVGYHDYTGGAHGMGGNRYFTLDLTSHKILKLNDLFDEKSLSQVKELLWANYTQDGAIKDDETFTKKTDFSVSGNIYLDAEGVHFIYSAYEIAPYAAGEPDLTLNWWQLKDLLKPEFKQQNYVKFDEDVKS